MWSMNIVSVKVEIINFHMMYAFTSKSIFSKRSMTLCNVFFNITVFEINLILVVQGFPQEF